MLSAAFSERGHDTSSQAYSPWRDVTARARVGAGVGAAVCQLLVLGHVSGGGDQWGEFASANNVLMLMLCRFRRSGECTMMRLKHVMIFRLGAFLK